MQLYYIKKQLHDQDVIQMTTSFGNEVKVYSVERTICDIVRSRNRLDIQVFSEAMKRFPTVKGVDYDKMSRIARRMNLEKVLRRYLEVLL